MPEKTEMVDWAGIVKEGRGDWSDFAGSVRLIKSRADKKNRGFDQLVQEIKSKVHSHAFALLTVYVLR